MHVLDELLRQAARITQDASRRELAGELTPEQAAREVGRAIGLQTVVRAVERGPDTATAHLTQLVLAVRAEAERLKDPIARAALEGRVEGVVEGMREVVGAGR